MRWLAPTLARLLDAGRPVSMITVVDARGSTPRGVGTRMLVTQGGGFFGTIGGGRLEYDAMAAARRLLETDGRPEVREVPLGPALGQCCGGHATVLIERADRHALEALQALESDDFGYVLTRLDRPGPRLVNGRGRSDHLPEPLRAAFSEWLRGSAGSAPERLVLADGSVWLLEPAVDDLPRVFLFGAGHVGRALAAALSVLPCRVQLFDHREGLLTDLPDGIEAFRSEHPEDRVLEAPQGTFFLVMTPSHDVDCRICEAVLKRGDFAFVGLIGSATKRARFEKRWRAKGIPEERIARLVCPIGLPGITGKEPVVIAAATAAQLLQAFECRPDPGPWRERRV